MNEKRIAVAIKTEGLDYDDRIRKEILTIQKLFPNVKFKIFAMLPENREYEGVTSYGIPFKAIYLPSREKYPSAKKILIKTLEFYKVIKKDIESFDAVWCGDYHSVAIALLCKGKPVLWDLHELPTMLLGNGLKKMVLRKVFHNCKVVLHANPQRIGYLQSQGCIEDPQKHYAIRNYPNFEDRDSVFDEAYYQFVRWKGNKTCAYLQGLTNDSRAAYESVAAVMTIQDLAAVVVGKFDDNSKKRLEKEFGNRLFDRIYFVGKIPQLKIPQYVEQCKLSLVFYKNVRPNNFFCEANRFYQSVIMGLPVVVGNNPSMKDIVEQYGFGVSIDDDGNNVGKIVNGINQVLNQYDEFHRNTKTYREKLLWDNQEDLIKEIVKKLL